MTAAATGTIVVLSAGAATAAPSTAVSRAAGDDPIVTVSPVDLGALPSFTYVSATSINDRGDIVGSGYSAPYDTHGFRWSRGALTALPDTARGPLRINNAGQIAGSIPGRFYSPGFVLRPDGSVVHLDFSVSDQNERGQVVGTGPLTGGTHAMLWRDGHTVDLGAPAGQSSGARAISGNGWILGDVQTNDHAHDHSARWIRGRWVPLPTATGYGSDINNRGDVVGWAATPTGDTHAMLWQGDRATDLDPHDPLSTAVAINDAGQILGSTYDPATNVGHILLWDHGRRTQLGDFGGLFARPVALNERGDIVVATSTAAFRRSHGRTERLGGSAQPIAINNRGQVVGSTSLPDGTSHAARWDWPERHP
ncbi:hypothetical protein [Frankia sp. AiPa1]|uniref:hypothetical protein n=1 Tax=Frankia sp. AiPa1 TaxID=573492 RepID=UPI00202B86C9|nr:hypothetical protein [Frankia sp. AiPa1]